MVLHQFLSLNHDELVARCRRKVEKRRLPRPSELELDHGISLFLQQLIETLKARQRSTPLPMVSTATLHGDELLRKGFTVDQVIHDYGDLCQAITEMADEVDAPITAGEFGTLNRCLDDAIAGAVTEYSRQREKTLDDMGTEKTNLRLGFLAHELRNLLNTATLSFEAIKLGSVALNGSTSALHERALRGLRTLVDQSLTEVRLSVGIHRERLHVADFIEEVRVAASLEANAMGVHFAVAPVPGDLAINADRQILGAVLANLLQNAFKFTRANNMMNTTLTVRHLGDRVFMDVADECGSLPANGGAEWFGPFKQGSEDRTGVGLGLAICWRGVHANDGLLHVRDVPGHGCVFSVELQLLPGRRTDIA
jgi:K+-sensing histidine kinase KdpD